MALPRLRRKKYNATAIKDRPTTPPATPPAMAPAWLFELFGLAVGVPECVLEVGVVLEDVGIVGVDVDVVLIVAGSMGVITK